jgi:hypothetical protein
VVEQSPELGAELRGLHRPSLFDPGKAPTELYDSVCEFMFLMIIECVKMKEINLQLDPGLCASGVENPRLKTRSD